MSFVLKNKFQIATFVSAVVLSVLLVALQVFGASLVDTDSVGVGTTTVGAGLHVTEGFTSVLDGDAYIYGQLNLAYLVATSTTDSSFVGNVGLASTTPGGALGVTGAAVVEGFVSADYFTSTSTNSSWVFGNVGIGTSTPGAALGVNGVALVEDHVRTSFLFATSTTATSTLSRFGSELASTTIVIDGASGRMAIGTSVVADSDVVATTLSNDPALTISGQGSANNATGTLYIAGEGGNGGQIILQSSNGLSSRCVSLVVNTGAIDVGGSGSDANTLIIAKVVSCPR